MMQEHKEQQELNNQYLHKNPLYKFKCQLKISICCSLARIISAIIVYYYADIFLCYIKDQSSQQSKVQMQQPWNTMFYLITCMVDIITLIGDTTILKYLSRQCKLLDTIASDIKNGVQPTVTPKGGQYRIYLSIYELILTYKFRHQTHASAYGVTRYMHFFSSFLVFGQMAIRHQSMSICTPFKQFFLWIFLLSVYITTYELDIIQIQTSSGPHRQFPTNIINIDRTKIKQVFINWRKFYQRITLIGIIFLVSSLITLIIRFQITLLFLFILILIGTNIATMLMDRSLIDNCQKIKQFHYHLYGLLRSTSQRYGYWFGFLSSFNRISLLLLIFAFLDNQYNQIILLIQLYFAIFLLILAQAFKLKRGLSSKIDMIIKKKVKQLKNIRHQCSICLLQFSQDSQVNILPCSIDHIYHTKCIKKWLKQKKECPLCRFDLTQYI